MDKVHVPEWVGKEFFEGNFSFFSRQISSCFEVVSCSGSSATADVVNLDAASVNNDGSNDDNVDDDGDDGERNYKSEWSNISVVCQLYFIDASETKVFFSSSFDNRDSFTCQWEIVSTTHDEHIVTLKNFSLLQHILVYCLTDECAEVELKKKLLKYKRQLHFQNCIIANISVH